MTTPTVDAAYTACEQVTRTEARNFHYGIRLLPADRRRVLCAVYALARRIDDIGDGDLPVAEKADRLAAVRQDLALLRRGSVPSDDPVWTALADAARRYPVPLGAFDELVDGVQADIEGRRYATFDELVGYCRCVAGSVGRLCLGVFGHAEHPQADRWADALGIALQQTNILRDVREDLLGGRVYLPSEDLQRYDVDLRTDDSGALADPDGRLRQLLTDGADRAAGWYAEGLQLVALLDRRSAACCTAMAGIYAELNARIGQHPELVLDRRLALSGWDKTAVAARALARRPVAGRLPVGRPR